MVVISKVLNKDPRTAPNNLRDATNSSFISGCGPNNYFVEMRKHIDLKTCNVFCNIPGPRDYSCRNGGACVGHAETNVVPVLRYVTSPQTCLL